MKWESSLSTEQTTLGLGAFSPALSGEKVCKKKKQKNLSPFGERGGGEAMGSQGAACVQNRSGGDCSLRGE